jgi:hypothetical protein
MSPPTADTRGEDPTVEYSDDFSTLLDEVKEALGHPYKTEDE